MNTFKENSFKTFYNFSTNQFQSILPLSPIRRSVSTMEQINRNYDSIIIDTPVPSPTPSPVSSPRLVGIELNPGPPKSIHKLAQDLANLTTQPKAKKGSGGQKGKGRGVPTSTHSSHREVAPVAMSTRMTSSTPKFQRSQNGNTIINHRELLANVIGNASFITSLFPMQPGIPGSFPWLSNIAINFEKYKFRKLQAHYLTRCSTATAGSVSLAFDYDASDGTPPSESLMANYSGMQEASPWYDIICKSNNLINRECFVRSGFIANTDIKLYDCANLILGTVDFSTSNVPAGKLWIEYEIELINPQSTSLLSNYNQYSFNSVWQTGWSGSAIFGTNVSTICPNSTKNPTSGPTVATGASTNQLVISGLTPQNNYQMTVTCIGTGLTYFSVAAVTFTGATMQNIVPGYSNSTGVYSSMVTTFIVNPGNSIVSIGFPTQSATTVQYAWVTIGTLGGAYFW
jgi:hypothetical protein